MSREVPTQLEGLLRRGQRSTRVINLARILLEADEGWTISQEAAALATSRRTTSRAKRRYTEEGLDGVLHDGPPANRYRKLDDRGQASLIALACSDELGAHDLWTLRLLVDKVVEFGVASSLSHVTLRHRLKKTSSCPGNSDPP